MKNNITKLYLFNIVIGFQTGLAAIGTVFQLLFSEVGGKELVTKLNQIDQYAIIISGVFIALNVMNIKIKKHISVLELIKSISFLILAAMLYFNKETITSIILIFILNALVYKSLYILWISFSMKIIEKEKFKEVFAKTVFLNTIAVIAGMILSYILIDIVYPYNFVIIFVITAISGAYLVVGTLSIEEISGNKENNKNLTLKEVLNVQKEKNCINMCLGKIILNFGYGITLLYAMLAIESGYTSRQIVELGFITFISMAICASVAGKLNMTHKQNMIAGHLLVAISVFSLFLTSNFYVAVVLIGLSNGIVNIGYYGFQNSLGEKRRHIYMSTQTTINITTGMGVFVAAKLIDNYSVNVAIIYSIVAVIISIGFVLRLKVPEEKLEILLEN